MFVDVVLRNLVNKMSRRTTLQERINAVKYVVEDGHSYPQAASKFHVSYQLIRSWVQKYEVSGYEGLVDHRYRHKAKATKAATELHKANLKIQELKEQLRNLQMMEVLAEKVLENKQKRSIK